MDKSAHISVQRIASTPDLVLEILLDQTDQQWKFNSPWLSPYLSLRPNNITQGRRSARDDCQLERNNRDHDIS